MLVAQERAIESAAILRCGWIHEIQRQRVGLQIDPLRQIGRSLNNIVFADWTSNAHIKGAVSAIESNDGGIRPKAEILLPIGRAYRVRALGRGGIWPRRFSA